MNKRDRADVLGCHIDRLDMEGTVRRCDELITAGVGAQHVSVNAAKLVALRNDKRLRAVVDGCDIVSADGQSVVWASRLLGDPLPSRVAGVDLMRELLEMAQARGYSVYFLGARQDALERALTAIEADFPRLVVAGARNGYFAAGESADIAAEIRRLRPHILFVAMSSPRKEYWLGDHGKDLGVPFRMGVGGSLDVWAGLTRRAPRQIQRLGLEWLYRLVQEPRRLAWRYVSTNTVFAVLLMRRIFTRWVST